MSLDRVPAGKDVPNDCNVVIEIPMRADPIKYEVDKETGAVFVDRFMSTAMHYPTQLRLHPAYAVRRRRSVRRARAVAGAAHHRRRGALPADRHAEDGRRGGRRREDPRGADRQAVVAVPRRAVAARPAGNHARARSRTSSSTTRTSSRASGCAWPSGSTPSKRSSEIIDGVARYKASLKRQEGAIAPWPWARSTFRSAVTRGDR